MNAGEWIDVGLAITALGAIVFQALRIGPERKKLSSEATTSATTAATSLTGSALDMVASERAGREGAEARATVAAARAEEAEMLERRWRRRVYQLEDVLNEHDIPIPPEVEHDDQT